MDIVRFKGGLGNQMFQYAFAEALRSRGRTVGCSLGFYRNHPDLRPFVLDKIFKNINLNEIDDQVFNQIDDKWKKIKEDPKKVGQMKDSPEKRFFYVEEEEFTYCDDVFQTNNCVFVGYWQTERYFKSIRDVILKTFEFEIKEPVLDELRKTLTTGNYISVHIRRGDYLKYPKFGDVCTEEYYFRAIAYMRERLPEARFIFFSDDIDWVKKIFTLEETIICHENLFDHYEDWYDMYLMTQCRGNIIANSTFSWWGAWLNQNKEQIVVAPKIWRMWGDTPDIWCDKWIML